jgi:hypothetical protein
MSEGANVNIDERLRDWVAPTYAPTRKGMYVCAPDVSTEGDLGSDRDAWWMAELVELRRENRILREQIGMVLRVMDRLAKLTG